MLPTSCIWKKKQVYMCTPMSSIPGRSWIWQKRRWDDRDLESFRIGRDLEIAFFIIIPHHAEAAQGWALFTCRESVEACSAWLCEFLHVYFIFGFLLLGCFFCGAKFRLILVRAVESIYIKVTAWDFFLSGLQNHGYWWTWHDGACLGFQHLKSNSTMVGSFHLISICPWWR